jgi:hypothetical protein
LSSNESSGVKHLLSRTLFDVSKFLKNHKKPILPDIDLIVS